MSKNNIDYENINNIKIDKKKAITLTMGIVAVIAVLIGLTYSYFTAPIEGNDDVSSIIVTSASLTATFNDSSEIDISNMLPGQSVTKTFQVRNTGGSIFYYDLLLADVESNIEGTDLVYTLTSTNGGGSVSETVLPTQSITLVSGVSVPNGSAQQYALTITYKNNPEVDQRNNIGSTFSARIELVSPYNEGTGIVREVTQTFNYTYPEEDYQLYTVQVQGWYEIEAWGAQGGSGTNVAGKGGYTSGKIYLEQGEKLYIYIGEQGKTITSGTTYYASSGYNGGGTGGNNSGAYSMGGGGATDIRYFGSGTPSSTDLVCDSSAGLNSRIMVAGGGGGTTTDALPIAGDGGNLIAGKGTAISGTYSGTGYNTNGGSQIVGGVNAYRADKNGIFGFALQTTASGYGGGGGGGYYGGSMGHGTGGGGGSSFISGYAGSATIIEDSSTDPRDHTTTYVNSNNETVELIDTLHYSGKYFLSGEMQAGVNSGNGRATITYIGSELPRANTALNNVRYIKDCINGNSVDYGNDWIDIQAIKNGTNIALGKVATGSLLMDVSSVTDGNINDVSLASTMANLSGTTTRFSYEISSISAGDIIHFFATANAVPTSIDFNDVALDATTYDVVLVDTNLYQISGSFEVTSYMVAGPPTRQIDFSTLYRFIDFAGAQITSASIKTFKNLTTFNNTRTPLTGNQCVVIDLGSEQDLDEVAVWHSWIDGRTYNDNITSVAGTDGVYREVINKTEPETSQGKRVSAYFDHQLFEYTGNYQMFRVPMNGYYEVETWGAQGGTTPTNFSGGRGGYASGKVYLTQGEKLYIYVGGSGTTGSTAVVATYPGGYNGGATGYVSRTNCTQTSASGGGATDVRIFGNEELSSSDLIWDSSIGLNSRVMVAAGGSGGFSEYCNATNDNASIYGADGGGLIGKTALYASYKGYSGLNPTGGTQVTGGQGLNAYNATSYVNNYIGLFGIGSTGAGSYSGAGGGYYGGACGAWQPGAGGSSFISGYAGSAAIIEGSITDQRDHTTSYVNSNNEIVELIDTKHYSEKYFVGGEMQAGVNFGNGRAKITYLGDGVLRINTALNNVRYIKDCTNGATQQNGTSSPNNHWVELQAIANGTNVAKGKVGTLYDVSNAVVEAHASYPFRHATDGDITSANYASGSTQTGSQCFVIDLGQEYNLDEVAVWHDWSDGRTYNDNITSVAGTNGVYRTVISTAAPETSQGKRVSAY